MITPITGKAVRWTDHVTHLFCIPADISIEQAHHQMLNRGADYAAVIDVKGCVLAMACFKNIASVLSAKFGLAVFAKRLLMEIRVPGKLLGAAYPDDEEIVFPVVIPASECLILSPRMDFFEAQHLFVLRPADRHFQDMIAVDEEGRCEGLISVRAFNHLQTSMLAWQTAELASRNSDLEQALGELSRAQKELVGSAKMAALGELVAGIAHEMNTPVGILGSSHDVIDKAFRLLENPASSPERQVQLRNLIRTNLELGREASDRVTRIVRSLKIFGRSDMEQFHRVNLAELLDATLTLLAGKIKSGMSVHVDYAEECQVMGFPSQLSQVFLNIITNACQAIHGNGDIYISVRTRDDECVVTVRDTGPGIPPHLLERVFDPGFTTKGVGVGTGLGLSLSRKIIEVHHSGRIHAANSPLGGAEIIIRLPCRHLEKNGAGATIPTTVMA